MKVICLNGPKRSGKGAMAEAATLTVPGAVVLSIATPIKRGALAARGLVPELWEELESVKDTPQAFLDGLTPRQVYLAHGAVCRADGRHLDEWVRLARDAQARGAEFLFMPDCRLKAEYHAARSVAGGLGGLLLVEVHRAGTSWSGDLGSYLDVPGPTWTFLNDQPIGTLGRRVESMLTRWLTMRLPVKLI